MQERLPCAQARRRVDAQQTAQEVEEEPVTGLHDLFERWQTQRAREDAVAARVHGEELIFLKLVDQVVAFFEQVRWDWTCTCVEIVTRHAILMVRTRRRIGYATS